MAHPSSQCRTSALDYRNTRPISAAVKVLASAQKKSAITNGNGNLTALPDANTPPLQPEPTTFPTQGSRSPTALFYALYQGDWAVANEFSGELRIWPQTQLAAIYLKLLAPELSTARQWLLRHGLHAEAQLASTPGTRQKNVAAGKTGVDPAPTEHVTVMGQRLFDALVQQLPLASAALQDLLDANATPSGAGLLTLTLKSLRDAGENLHLPLTMLDRGADPFASDTWGLTPLHLAAELGHHALLHALLTQGCNPNARDAFGRTPLWIALRHGSQARALVHELVLYGADAEAIDANGETPLGLAQDYPDIEHLLNWGQWSRPLRPLRADDLPAAARMGATVAVDRLLELGFPANTTDLHGASALLHACNHGHHDIATALIVAGAHTTLATNKGITPLAAAIGSEHTTLLTLLLDHGVIVDQRLPEDATALILAAALGHAHLVEKLLHAGAAISAVDAHGCSALHAAARFGFEHCNSQRTRQLFDVLITHKAEINHTDNDGKTPLLHLLGALHGPGSHCHPNHLAALVPVLLNAGAALEHTDRNGMSALHACAMHALLPAVRVLLSSGARRDTRDAFGRTPADVARQLGYVDIAHELETRHHSTNQNMPSVQQTLRWSADP